jgi:predicted house-cleaning noncanonical NTP pyrophosphatase (MazG superfamily)
MHNQLIEFMGGGMVLANIGSFLKALGELGMLVTKRASYKLENFQKKLSQKEYGAYLTTEEAEELRDIMTEIRHTFMAEAKGILAYVVTEKRWDLKKLLGNIEELFRPKVFFSCSEIAQYDFQEAGLCIAFERPTAAAFHLLRGMLC